MEHTLASLQKALEEYPGLLRRALFRQSKAEAALEEINEEVRAMQERASNAPYYQRESADEELSELLREQEKAEKESTHADIELEVLQAKLETYQMLITILIAQQSDRHQKGSSK